MRTSFAVFLAVLVGLCPACMRFILFSEGDADTGVDAQEQDTHSDTEDEGDALHDVSDSSVVDADREGCFADCGNGAVECDEQCDDGNTVNGDGCSSRCRVEGRCGNGVLDIADDEECDDGGRVNGDGCSDTCQLEPVGADCGNGSTNGPEVCDDGNTSNGDGCNPTCNLTTTVTTLATGLIGHSLALDDEALWIGVCDPPSNPTVCEIRRLDIEDCLHRGSCTPVAVAGGACGHPADGTGNLAALSCVGTMTTDGATLWFDNTHTIRAMDLETYEVTTVAGNTGSCAAVDGSGTDAYFHDIRGLTYSSGFVYLLDGCEQVLRRFDPISGEVVTIAGQRIPDLSVPQSPPYPCPGSWSCRDGVPADGNGLAAGFGSPRYMTTDHDGHLYITDTNGVGVRVYDIESGWVSTLIGGHLSGGAFYQDGIGPAVGLLRPRGLTSDGTSLYWGEQTAHTIRQVIIDSLEASTLIGVRGCSGNIDGVGGDGTIDWTGSCNAPQIATMTRLDTPMGGLVFHYPSRSLFLLESGRLRQVQ